MNRRILALVAVLCAVIGVTRWLLQRQTEDQAPDALPAAQADYMLENFELVVMNPLGQTRFLLTAPRLERFPEDGSARVEAPHIDLFASGVRQWTLTANEGWIGDDATEVRFSGDVDLSSTAANPTRIETQAVTIFPDRSFAEGPGHVLITEPTSRMEGVGFRADLAAETWQLLSAVHGTLLPSPEPTTQDP